MLTSDLTHSTPLFLPTASLHSVLYTHSTVLSCFYIPTGYLPAFIPSMYRPQIIHLYYILEADSGCVRDIPQFTKQFNQSQCESPTPISLRATPPGDNLPCTIWPDLSLYMFSYFSNGRSAALFPACVRLRYVR